MEFIYYYERAKFEKEHEKMRREYRAAGMSEEAIDEMVKWDWERFKEERCYIMHADDLDIYRDDSQGDEYKDPMIGKYAASFTADNDGYCVNDYIDFSSPIDQGQICKVLKSLTDNQMEIFRLYVLNNMSQIEIAEALEISAVAVHHQMERIRKKFKKYF